MLLGVIGLTKPAERDSLHLRGMEGCGPLHPALYKPEAMVCPGEILPMP